MKICCLLIVVVALSILYESSEPLLHVSVISKYVYNIKPTYQFVPFA